MSYLYFKIILLLSTLTNISVLYMYVFTQHKTVKPRKFKKKISTLLIFTKLLVGP